MKVCRSLVRVADAEQGRLVDGPANQLHADRQAVIIEPAGHAFSAGRPVRLATPVNCMMAESMSSSPLSSITTVVAPIGVAVNGSVGQTKTSTLRNALPGFALPG